MQHTIAVVDTTFARVDMGAIALQQLRKHSGVQVMRSTVPGIKDLAVECKRLLEKGAEACIALGWVGGAEIDRQCAHEASIGIQHAKLLTNKHILEVFVFEFEAEDPSKLRKLAENRARKHAENAYLLLADPASFSENAGKGLRQGKEDAGPLR